jgi:hypothetical protein
LDGVMKALRLERNAKWGLAGLLFVLALLFATVIWHSVVALTPEQTVAAPTPESEDELIEIGGHTLLLKHGTAGNKIAHWLHAGSGGSRAFELGNLSFAPNSDAFTPEGERRVGTIADIMVHARALDAHIYASSAAADQRLEEKRATHLRGDLIAKGVTASRIEVYDDPIEGGEALSKQPEVVVVLSA